MIMTNLSVLSLRMVLFICTIKGKLQLYFQLFDLFTFDGREELELASHIIRRNRFNSK